MAVNTGYTTAGADAVQMLSPTGEETISRENVVGSSAVGSGFLTLSYFTARHTGNVNSVITYAAIGAGATPTLCRIGIYSVASNGNLTLIGSTANDTALWNASSTMFTKALSNATPITAGSTYAVGVLYVTAASQPTLAVGPTALSGTVQALAPRMTAVLSGQSNLPSTIASGSLTSTGFKVYARLVP